MHKFVVLKNYLRQDLGAFYGHAANRLMLYPFIFSFFMVECASFWLLYLGPAFVLDFMAFTTVYTLHKAGVYAVSILATDIAAHHLIPSKGNYHQRTIGRQWLIWSLGLVIGFVLQQTMIRSLIVLYAPEVVDYLNAHPGARLGTTTILLILIPYWIVVVFLTLQVALSKQRIQKQADAILVLPGETTGKPGSSAGRAAGLPRGRLRVDGESGNGNSTISLADITHVTVEDHYCRINYTSGDSLKSTLVRLPLKQMLSKLPREHFMQIHRSHVVNRGYVRRLAKSGRDHKLGLQHVDMALPVSRSRLRTLQSWLDATESGES